MTKWNKGFLDSFLIEITSEILKYKNEQGQYLVEQIMDAAGQKGTGKWTTSAALEFGIPVTLIGKKPAKAILLSLLSCCISCQFIWLGFVYVQQAKLSLLVVCPP